MIAGVIDYGAGNIRSVCNALDAIGVERRLVPDGDALTGVDALIFPGVGAFGDCARNLEERDLMEPLRNWIAADRPFLGICIGYQMLFEASEESPGVAGVGAFAGKVVRFPSQADLKVPHMGWNQLQLTDPHDPAWFGLGDTPFFYFVHSYFPEPDDSSLIASTTLYGVSFASSIRCGKLLATQFHPEKSQAAGAKLISNFLDLARA